VNTEARPLLSVCIANYNGAAILRDCIDSVLAQAGAHPLELIVHDDASDDGSLELLRSAYPDVRVIASEANVGFCIANNRMVRAARGEYVLLLNNDAALLPGALDALVAAARTQPRPAIFTLPQVDWQDGRLVDRGCLLDPFNNPVPNLDPARSEVAMAIGACLFLPRALWDELGGFPDWFGSIGEDLYLCGLARLRGYPVLALAHGGYRHRQGHSFGGNRPDGTRLSSTLRRRRLSERNKTLALAVLTPGLVAWPLLALHLAALVLEGVVLALARLDATLFARIYAHAAAELVRQARHGWPARRQAQRTRTVTARAYFRCFVPYPRKLALLLKHGFPTVRR
jgi:GT2 family glycosyltransferase